MLNIKESINMSKKSFIVIRQLPNKKDDEKNLDVSTYCAESSPEAWAFYNKKPLSAYFNLLYTKTKIKDRLADPLAIQVFKESIGETSSAAETENQMNQLIHENIEEVFREAKENKLVALYLTAAISRMEKVFYQGMVAEPMIVSLNNDVKKLPEHVGVFNINGLFWYISTKYGPESESIELAKKLSASGSVTLPPYE
jgi:hypothetical protein